MVKPLYSNYILSLCPKEKALIDSTYLAVQPEPTDLLKTEKIPSVLNILSAKSTEIHPLNMMSNSM